MPTIFDPPPDQPNPFDPPDLTPLIGDMKALGIAAQQAVKTLEGFGKALERSDKIQKETNETIRERFSIEKEIANLQGEFLRKQKQLLQGDGRTLEYRAKSLKLLKKESEAAKVFAEWKEKGFEWTKLTQEQQDKISKVALKVSQAEELKARGFSKSQLGGMPGLDEDVINALQPNKFAHATSGALRKATGLEARELMNIDLTRPASWAGLFTGMNPWMKGITMGSTALMGGLHGMTIPLINKHLPGFHEINKMGMSTGEGFGAGLSGMWQGFKMGANPFDMISMRMASEIVKGIRGKGFRGELANALGDSIVGIVKDTGLEWSEVLESANYFLRETNVGLNEFNSVMKNLDDLARDTGLSVDQVAKGIKEFSQLLGEHGATSGTAIRAEKLEELFTGYGLTSEQAVGFFSNVEQMGYMSGLQPYEINTQFGLEKIMGGIRDAAAFAMEGFPQWRATFGKNLSDKDALASYAEFLSLNEGHPYFGGKDDKAILEILQASQSGELAKAPNEIQASGIREAEIYALSDEELKSRYKELDIEGLSEEEFIQAMKTGRTPGRSIISKGVGRTVDRIDLGAEFEETRRRIIENARQSGVSQAALEMLEGAVGSDSRTWAETIDRAESLIKISPEEVDAIWQGIRVFVGVDRQQRLTIRDASFAQGQELSAARGDVRRSSSQERNHTLQARGYSWRSR